MNSCFVTCFWLVLTLFCTLIMIFTAISPVWIENTTRDLSYFNNTRFYYESIVSFGILRYCRRYELNNPITLCNFYHHFSTLPSIPWIISLFIYSIGIVLFILSLIFSLTLVCVGSRQDKNIRLVIYYIQIIAVLFLVIFVIMFPLCFDSAFARDICGSDTKMFILGECKIAWGYTLNIVAVALTIFCPIIIKSSINFTKSYTSSHYDVYTYDVKNENSSVNKTQPPKEKITTV